MLSPNFETRRLQLLHEFRLRGTVTAVAEALAYSPSSVSHQLSVLAREAGVPLLEPDGRRLRLTVHGEALADHARQVLDLEEMVRGSFETAGPAVVRAGIFQSAAHAILPRALTALAASHPELRLESAEVPPEEGLFELAARGFDLVIAEQYPGHTREHHADLARDEIGRDAIRIATPPRDRAGDLAALRDRPWVMEPVGTASRQWAVQQCRAAGFDPDVRFEAADLTTHVRLIAAGHAVGLLPGLVWSDTPVPVRLVDLVGAPQREIFVASRTASAARPATTTVREALRAAFAEVASQAAQQK